MIFIDYAKCSCEEMNWEESLKKRQACGETQVKKKIRHRDMSAISDDQKVLNKGRWK